MENRTEFYRLERRKVLKLLRELNEELIATNMNFLMGDICFEEFIELRNPIKFRIDVAKEVGEEIESILKNVMLEEYEPVWTEDDDDDYDDEDDEDDDDYVW